MKAVKSGMDAQKGYGHYDWGMSFLSIISFSWFEEQKLQNVNLLQQRH